MNTDSALVRWARFFIEKYRVSILLLIAILIFGVWGLVNNQRQDFPPIPVNIGVVTAVYPGASAEDVEQDVLVPLEQAVGSVDGVDSVRSTASSNFGSIVAEIGNINQTKEVLAKITDEVDKVNVPNDVTVNVQEIQAAGPAVALGLVGGNGETTNDLLALAPTITPRLEGASKEIDRVEVVPADEFQVEIRLDAAALLKNGLSAQAVKQAVQSATTSLPGGSVQDAAGRNETITVSAAVESMDALRALQLGRVTLGDVATITRTPKDADSIHYGGFVQDGTAYSRQAVYFLVYKKDDGDIIRISDAVNAEVQAMEDAGVLPGGMQLVTLYSTAPYISSQISSLLWNGYLGLALILIVLLFFINLRTAVVVSLIIPLAFLITIGMLHALGYSINILTLFAMILTLGILVDNAIVIAEGMVHELEKGVSRKDASLLAVKKLGGAVTAATLTTVVVFIPFASLGGIIGAFLKYIPYTIIIMLTSSYFLAISITPLLGRWLLREQTYEERRKATLKNWQRALIIPAIVHWGQNSIDWLARFYRHHMRQTYANKWKEWAVIVGTMVLLVVSFSVFAPRLTFEQFPSDDSTTMTVDLTFPVGITLAEEQDVFQRVQDQLITLPYFENFFVFGNQITATFTDPAERTDATTIFDINDQFESKLSTAVVPEISEDISIQSNAASYGPPASAYNMVVEFVGQNPEAIARAADDVSAYVSGKEDVQEVQNVVQEERQPSIVVDLDAEKLAARNVDPLIAAGVVNTTFSEQKIGSFVTRTDGVSDELTLTFDEASTDSVDDLRSLLLPSASGAPVRLDAVATIASEQKPKDIKRLDGKRVATVNIALKDDLAADVTTAFEQDVKEYITEDRLAEWGLEKDSVVYGGEYATFQEDYSNLQIIFLLAMIAVYLILVFQFNSFIQPLVILFAVPLAFIGVFPGLFIVGSSLNMISGLGVIALVGIVVNDAIVFLSTYNRYRKEFPEERAYEVLVRTGYARFKPIFSTSITTIGGILPLTIIDPFWRGLGTSIIAGLTFSTLGTLIAIPILYNLFHKRKRPLPAEQKA